MVNTFTRLANMTPGERTQERSHSRGSHHRMSQHPPGRPGPQQINMVDMGTAHQHRRHQRQNLTTRVRSTHPAPQAHRPIHQIFQPQPIHQRPRHQQTRVGYQPLIIENHPIPVDIVRYSTHRKCLQTPGQQPFLLQLLSQIRGTFRVYPPPNPQHSIGGSRLTLSLNPPMGFPGGRSGVVWGWRAGWFRWCLGGLMMW